MAALEWDLPKLNLTVVRVGDRCIERVREHAEPAYSVYVAECRKALAVIRKQREEEKDRLLAGADRRLERSGDAMGTIDRRYQVFVSSTYKDLKKERQAVMHALLGLDCMPSGMELFPAANEAQWEVIRKVIDECDYYVLILAGRYGSLAADGTGYTEKEYRYALNKGKPILGFLHSEPGRIQSQHTERTDKGRQRLKEFRELVEKKLCKDWDTPEGLGQAVTQSIVRIIKEEPRAGWVRAGQVPVRDANEEMLALRTEVATLKKENEYLRERPPLDGDSGSSDAPHRWHVLKEHCEACVAAMAVPFWYVNKRTGKKLPTGQVIMEAEWQTDMQLFIRLFRKRKRDGYRDLGVDRSKALRIIENANVACRLVDQEFEGGEQEHARGVLFANLPRPLMGMVKEFEEWADKVSALPSNQRAMIEELKRYLRQRPRLA